MMKISHLVKELEESSDIMPQLQEIKIDLRNWNKFKRFVANNEASSTAWLKEFHHYELYSDEDDVYIIKTDCPLHVFEAILREFKEKNSEFSYTYDDFFDTVRRGGWEIKALTPEASIYF